MRISGQYLFYLVVLSLIGAAARWTGLEAWRFFEVAGLLLGIVITGIPHGAMDHYIARQQAINEGRAFHIRHFIATYVVWILLYSALWWMSPGCSLLLFLVLSAWHFGETDLEFSGSSPRWKFVKTLLYGASLVAWLLLHHPLELASWIKLLVPAFTTATEVIAVVQQIPLPLFYVILVVLLLPVNSQRKHKWGIWLALCAFIFLCGQMSLLSGFTLYFTGWHGVLAFIDIYNFLPLRGKLMAVWRNSLPLSILSYTFLLGIYFFTSAEVWQNSGLPAIFILLSLLTLPHTQVMHRLYRRTEIV